MEQIPLRLFFRHDAPSVVPSGAVAACATYRDAVQLCWEQRKVRNMSKAMLAERAGLYASHVTSYLSKSCKAKHRNLPADGIAGFQLACNNTAITQWLAMQSQLTVAEEAIADRQAERAAA